VSYTNQERSDYEGVSYVEQIEKYRRDAMKRTEAIEGEVLHPEKNDAYRMRRAKKRSMDPMPILRGINEAFSQDEITLALREAYEIAMESRSVEDILRVIRFVTSYQVGTPVARSVSAHISSENLAAFFSDEPVDNEEKTV
jgi:hypothetical protein